MTAALVYRALERNTPGIGNPSTPCVSESAKNPEIAALTQVRLLFYSDFSTKLNDDATDLLIHQFSIKILQRPMLLQSTKLLLLLWPFKLPRLVEILKSLWNLALSLRWVLRVCDKQCIITDYRNCLIHRDRWVITVDEEILVMIKTILLAVSLLK